MYIVLCNYCKANSVSLAPAENLRADNNRCNFDLASANTELSSEKATSFDQTKLKQTIKFEICDHAALLLGITLADGRDAFVYVVLPER